MATEPKPTAPSIPEPPELISLSRYAGQGYGTVEPIALACIYRELRCIRLWLYLIAPFVSLAACSLAALAWKVR
jgi:hypothetical protein